MTDQQLHDPRKWENEAMSLAAQWVSLAQWATSGLSGNDASTNADAAREALRAHLRTAPAASQSDYATKLNAARYLWLRERCSYLDFAPPAMLGAVARVGTELWSKKYPHGGPGSAGEFVGQAWDVAIDAAMAGTEA